jgi:hypothetical protein
MPSRDGSRAVLSGLGDPARVFAGDEGRRGGSDLFDIAGSFEYVFGMKSNTKSSITLPPEELKLVISLQGRLKAKSKVEVVRRGLRMLDETTNRERMREAYRRASLATRKSLADELKELDALAGEGLEDW